MSARAIQDQKAIASGTFVQQAVHGNALVPSSAHQGHTIATIEMGADYVFKSAAEKQLNKPLDRAFARVNAAKFIGSLQQSEILAQRQSPRIAFKAKGRIIFMDLGEIVAVQAEGNYVSLLRQPNSYLLRESLSSIAEKLKPYGFIRIHRSVVVNTLVVEEIQPLQTGEYRLRLKGGKEYIVTRRYKDNLRYLAQLWLGSERLRG
jgi:two-component system LytT family response regulator